MVWKKLIPFVAVCILTVAATCGTVNAQSYSDEYPNVFNSGSPYWFRCTVDGEDYVVLLDPNINPQSFGFDNPTGYNLINNTGSSISGRAYNTKNSSGYLVRFPSYYGMQFKEPGSAIANTWFDVYITDISATTLDFIDYNGNRGNDKLSREELRFGYEMAQTIVIVTIGLCLFIRPIFSFTYRQRGIDRS